MRLGGNIKKKKTKGRAAVKPNVAVVTTVATARDLEPPLIHRCQLPVPFAQICVYGFGKRREERRRKEKKGKEENIET
uniref:Uncharacterized protein n=1 Tax=Medicago truncatula TaxID=3880 RepID=A2Q1T3_MEDTR|nr:hypothetical protein MtrDRAFT_AC149040g43v2 [Medicago truncatula]